ncbi:hypothetical protein PFISCL1PPCAC_18713, partial [Pristionchus fissidentatus]
PLPSLLSPLSLNQAPRQSPIKIHGIQMASGLAQEKLARIHSVSSLRLSQVLSEWRCCNNKCKMATYKLGGFGPLSDSDATPFSLHCGHYLCGDCKEKRSKCNHDFECSRCFIETSPAAMKNLPVAQHIQKLAPLFLSQGIVCENCTCREDERNTKEHKLVGGLIQGRSRDVRVRYPSEMMFVYAGDDGSHPLLSHSSIRRYKTKGKEAKPHVLCVFCVHSLDSALFPHFHRLDDIVNRDDNYDTQLIQEVRSLLEKEKIDFTSADHRKCKPWSLAALSPSQMTQFLD